VNRPLLRAGTALSVLAVGAAIRSARGGHPGAGQPVQTGWRRRITSHEAVTHDSIDSLGYDWARIADPAMDARPPKKIHLPETTQDIVDAVREAAQLGEHLVVRSRGHSSNDLTIADRGTVLLVDRLDRIIELDETAMTVTVQSGVISAELDEWLAARGLGLPVIGDHNDITVGGFASVGGISPASHRYGMFVDQVDALEYVTWTGDVVRCSPTERPEDFWRVLCGLGRYGVIASLTLRVVEADKYRTVLVNRQHRFRDVEAFIEHSARHLRHPGDALMARGVWLDFPRGADRSGGIGQFSAYHATAQTDLARLRDRLGYGYLHRIGYVAGRLPASIDRAVKYLGTAGLVFSPRYGTVKNVESFSDRVLDATAGDPTRMFIVLAPLERYETIVRGAYELVRDFRQEHRCFTFISTYVKPVRSSYLARAGGEGAVCELTLTCGIVPERFPEALLEQFARRLDDLCIVHRAWRYMHTRTSRDPQRARLVDPNAFRDGGPAREEVTRAP
jgi:hypothetical protein